MDKMIKKCSETIDSEAITRLLADLFPPDYHYGLNILCF